MGLQLGNYGSDTDSDEDSADLPQLRASDKACITSDATEKDQLGSKGIARGRGKQPIKIGSSHALLRRAEDPLQPSDDETRDPENTSSSKRTRTSAGTRTTGGKSGLIDMLPPPKKKPKIMPKSIPPSNMPVASSPDTHGSGTNSEELENVSYRHTGPSIPGLNANDRIDLFGLGKPER